MAGNEYDAWLAGETTPLSEDELAYIAEASGLLVEALQAIERARFAIEEYLGRGVKDLHAEILQIQEELEKLS